MFSDHLTGLIPHSGDVTFHGVLKCVQHAHPQEKGETQSCVEHETVCAKTYPNTHARAPPSLSAPFSVSLSPRLSTLPSHCRQGVCECHDKSVQIASVSVDGDALSRDGRTGWRMHVYPSRHLSCQRQAMRHTIISPW